MYIKFEEKMNGFKTLVRVKLGIELVRKCGDRDSTEQARLYAIGRDAQGNVVDQLKVVTNAPAGSSWHEYGLAEDIAPKDWNLKQSEIDAIGLLGKSLGLEWGYYIKDRNGKQLHDWPHWQFTNGIKIWQAKQIVRASGIEELWKAVNIY